MLETPLCDELLRRLFREDDIRLFEGTPMFFQCSCSRERVAGILQALGAEEVHALLRERGDVEVRCEFCNRAWRFRRRGRRRALCGGPGPAGAAGTALRAARGSVLAVRGESHPVQHAEQHGGNDEGYRLTPEDCAKLQVEALQYHQRYFCLLQLEDYDGVVRDAERNLAKAYASVGWIAMVGNDLSDASRHFERALALDPSDLNVLGNAASLLQSLGRPGEALALLETIVRRDPLNVSAIYNLAVAQRWAGQLDQAIASYQTVLSLSPGRGGARSGLGETLLLKGDASGALAEIERETSEFWRMIALPKAYHALGRHADSDAALAALIESYESDASYNIATICAFRGETDLAFEWLGKAIEYEDPGLSEIVIDDLFVPVRSDPRWLPLLRQLGKAPEQLAQIDFDVVASASNIP